MEFFTYGSVGSWFEGGVFFCVLVSWMDLSEGWGHVSSAGPEGIWGPGDTPGDAQHYPRKSWCWMGFVVASVVVQAGGAIPSTGELIRKKCPHDVSRCAAVHACADQGRSSVGSPGCTGHRVKTKILHKSAYFHRVCTPESKTCAPVQAVHPEVVCSSSAPGCNVA